MARPGPRARTDSRSVAGDDTRAKILQATLEALHQEGVLGASARSIARRGGFNQGLIFYHFGGINGLLLAAVDELSARRADRYEQRLESISSLRELVAVAGELHREDLDDGHITVLSQMLAAAAANDDLRAPMRERFEPWINVVERSLERALSTMPYGSIVPQRDLAVAITACFVGLELILQLEDDAGGRDHSVFQSIEALAGVLEMMLAMLPPPPPRAF